MVSKYDLPETGISDELYPENVPGETISKYNVHKYKTAITTKTSFLLI